ncbi:MAG TPA: DEAD/DEAH box helicase, partial [Thermoanaerobaculia bacterium]|nr:DEAD/DEAH box helicase [Thermoanaerobaculia bacterium]
MPVPDRFRSSFSPATLQTLEAHQTRFRVSDPLFFRGAYTADVTENERRTFRPILIAAGETFRMTRCACQPTMKPHDLCRHLGILIAHMSDASGVLAAEKFEQSIWRAIAFASFSEGRAIDEHSVTDPRELLLRKYALTPAEQQLLDRGSGSARLQFESSPWYRWAKEMFVRGADARISFRDGGFHLDGASVPIPAAAVEHIIAHAPEVVTASGFEIAAQTLTPSLRIEITRMRALRFTPVLLGSAGVIHDRAQLPNFGKFFLIGNRLASPEAALPMFAERAEHGQTALFEVRPSAGLPYDRESTIAEAEVFAFVERHRAELARMPEALAPEPVRNAKPVRLDGEVVFDFAEPSSRQADQSPSDPSTTRRLGDSTTLLEIEIAFLAGESSVSAADIARARRDGIRALIRGNLWIDVTDPQFAWLDEATIGPRGHVLVTKLELLRIRGSLRGKAVFRGDPTCERVFRLFDEIQTDSDAPSPSALGLDLYAYQQTGYQWLWLLQQNGFGGLLCDDMGLGKTHQAIALIAALVKADPSLHILVVCPTSLIDHWKDKLARYAPGVPITLTTYGLVRTRIEQFRGKRFDLVVLDEMQTIKNSDTATSHALRAIEKRIAIGLTGTPIENHEGELKALLDFVVPGYLPKYVDDRSTLQRLVRPFVLRRTKAQVLTELPPKIVDKRYCELTSEQRALYNRVLEARAKPLRAQLRAGQTVSYVHVFAALNYLKQVCNHPASAGGGFGEDVPSGKWDMFVELLNECMSSGLKVVVFSQYLSMLDLIEKHLVVQDIGYASIRGGTRERGQEIARFRDDPDCRVFTASLRAGGLGIDLTSASVVIHYDRWWNQAREDQATDRVHRLGQNKGVQVIKLISRHTIEEKIDALIESKAALATDLIRPDDPS